MFPCEPTCMSSIGMDMNMNIGTNRAMCMQSGMTSCAPPMSCPHMNQSIQAPMLQMPHHYDTAMEMLLSSQDGIPYHLFNVVSGQTEVSSQVNDYNPWCFLHIS
jgi:hypothetical protein